MRKLIIVYAISFSTAGAVAQEAEPEEKPLAYDSTFMASPGIRFQQRPKAFILSYDRIINTPVNSFSEVTGPGFAQLYKVEEMKLKLKFPFKWKGRTKFFGGLNYFYQEYNFENPGQLNYEFYEALENRHLNSLAGQLYVTHSFSRNRFLVSRFGGELNGDYRDDFVSLSKFFKGSVSGIYGWRKHQDLSYGFGFYFNYDLGGPSIYPAFMYNRNFNNKWGIESVFPKEVFIRWNTTERTFIYGGYEVSGSTFQLVFDQLNLSDSRILQLQRSNIRTKLVLEQEIHDFIWIGIEGGVHFTVNMDLSDEVALFTLEDEIIDTRFGPAPFVQFMLFLVPPRSLTKKALTP